MKHLTALQQLELEQLMQARTGALAQRVREELAASDHQHFRDLAGAVADVADAALASELVDVDAAVIDRHVSELRDLDAARQRIKDGSYGLCIECTDAIPYARLKAYLTAKRCLPCQQQREHNYVHPATPSL